MRLILGGAHQGKLTYVLHTYGYQREQVTETFAGAKTAAVFYHLERALRRALEQGQDYQQALKEVLRENPTIIFICDEVGCGVVPIDPTERKWREVVGRTCCELAQQAETVERIFCGLPMKLKGNETMELYLLRHGATPGNLLGQYIGSTDQPLAEEGIAAAKEKHYPTPEQLWVSPMRRARETASIFFPGVTQHVMEDLRELDFGDWEEKTWSEVNDAATYDGWLSEDPTACYPGGETLGAFAARTSGALWSIVEEAEKAQLQRIAIVAHGGVLMSLMHQFGLPKRENFFLWMSPNCGGYRVTVNLENRQLTLLEELGK